MIRTSNEIVSAAFDDRVLVVKLVLFAGMILHILLDLFSRQTLCIKSTARRHRLGAGERVIVVDNIESAAVDHEQSAELRIFGGFVERESLRIALPPIDGFEVLRGLHELLNHLALTCAER